MQVSVIEFTAQHLGAFRVLGDDDRHLLHACLLVHAVWTAAWADAHDNRSFARRNLAALDQLLSRPRG